MLSITVNNCCICSFSLPLAQVHGGAKDVRTAKGSSTSQHRAATDPRDFNVPPVPETSRVLSTHVVRVLPSRLTSRIQEAGRTSGSEGEDAGSSRDVPQHLISRTGDRAAIRSFSVKHDVFIKRRDHSAATTP